MRVAIITSRAAAGHIRRLVEGLSDVVVVELPVNVAGLLTARAIAAILGRRRDLLEAARSGDVVLIPGGVRGDARVIAEVVGRPVFKGTRSSGAIPFLVRYLRSGGRLDAERPAEEVLGRLPTLGPGEEAFRVGPVPVPRRGPPAVLAAEIPPEARDEDVHLEAERLAGDGARIIVVGARPDWEPGRLAWRVSRAADAVPGGVAVAAEAPSLAHARAAVAAGAEALWTGPAAALEAAEAGLDAAIVVGDRSLDVLASVVAELEELGHRRVAVDPVLDVPPLGMAESLDRHRAALGLGVPLAFSAANAASEVEADTHGVHAVLALLAAELRASIYLVVEDSWKTRRSTAEALEALRLAWEAWRRGSSERGLFSRLLVVKQASRPPSADSRGAEDAGCVEPRMDPRGYLVIGVDHDRGFIVVEWRPFRGGPVRLRGKHATSLARALVRRVGLDAEHAAYLGYELAKAEMALALGRGYTQDEPLMVPVWRLASTSCRDGPGEGDTGGGALRGQGVEGARSEPRAEGEGGGPGEAIVAGEAGEQDARPGGKAGQGRQAPGAGGAGAPSGGREGPEKTRLRHTTIRSRR